MQLLFSADPDSRLVKVFRSYLASGCAIGATSLTLESEDIDLLPEPDSGEGFVLRVGDDSDAEEIIVTGRSGTTLTCLPTLKAWAYGAAVIATISPYMLGEFVQRTELGTAASADSDDFQPAHALLTAIAGISAAANKLILLTGTAAASVIAFAAWAQDFISAASMVLKSYSEALGTYTLSAGTLNFDCATGNVFSVALTSNVSTVVFSNVPSALFAITIKIKQDGTGGRTVAGWPSTKWPGGTAPTITSAANAVDIISGFYDSESSVWRLGMAHADSK